MYKKWMKANVFVHVSKKNPQSFYSATLRKQTKNKQSALN